MSVMSESVIRARASSYLKESDLSTSKIIENPINRISGIMTPMICNTEVSEKRAFDADRSYLEKKNSLRIFSPCRGKGDYFTKFKYITDSINHIDGSEKSRLGEKEGNSLITIGNSSISGKIGNLLAGNKSGKKDLEFFYGWKPSNHEVHYFDGHKIYHNKIDPKAREFRKAYVATDK